MSIVKIAQQIVSIGSNCVRLPFSIDLWKMDPTPPKSAVGKAISTECGQNSSAMGLFDCVIHHLTSMGVMVILNNHNSFAGWVGVDGTNQGLWDLQNYSVFTWLDCLEHMADRYKNNSLVVGMDIRNEIHDMDEVYITWGKSNNIATDWRAASSMAAKRIEAVNQNMLVIVSGLCFGYDFTEMMDMPGPISALNRRKLVYTAHVYTWDWWWTRIPWLWVNAFAIVLFLFGSIVGAKQYKRIKQIPRPSFADAACHLISGFGPFALCWGATYVFWYHAVGSIGCNAFVQSLNPAIRFYFFMAFLSVPCMIKVRIFSDSESRRIWLLLVGVLCCVQATFLIVLAIVSQSYFMVERELSRWNLVGRPVPLWVGEFGSAWDDESVVWKHLLRFLKSHELDFAYWPLNGLKWDQREQRWLDERFGLLGPDYTGLRNPELVSFLFG